MSQQPIIVWLRSDLRIKDNSVISNAAKTGQPLIFLYIFDENRPWALGAASRWWLHHSLKALNEDLEKRENTLLLKRGDTLDIIEDVVNTSGASGLFFQRLYDPWERDIEARLFQTFKDNILVKRFAGYLLFEPESIKNLSGLPYRVFTPFWRCCRDKLVGSKLQSAPKTLPPWKDVKKLKSEKLSNWKLLPSNPNWAKHFSEKWQPGEAGAQKNLKIFIADALDNYKRGRDMPALESTSQLSPHLHFGEISPRTIVSHILKLEESATDENMRTFLSEVGWREFSHHLLFHWPHISDKVFNPKFSDFPWKKNKKHLNAWQRGQTGFPIIDAGMRELWQSGWMHNRVRMIVASLLTKNLLQPWQNGAEWFWDTLVDANLANNSAGWQWVAGSGADAAPYFRIFNPITQSQKFDKEADYIRLWVPELAKLPNKYIHEPWKAPSDILNDANLVLGKDYPKPIVDLKVTRERALEAHNTIK